LLQPVIVELLVFTAMNELTGLKYLALLSDSSGMLGIVVLHD